MFASYCVLDGYDANVTFRLNADVSKVADWSVCRLGALSGKLFLFFNEGRTQRRRHTTSVTRSTYTYDVQLRRYIDNGEKKSY